MRPAARARLAALAALAAGVGCVNAEHATVARVIDGDTIALTTGDTVRYLLVDAPETTNGHHDCYGAAASELETELVLGKDIELSYDVERTDRYGRLLAYVTVDGREVNRLLVERGYACVLHIPPDGDARAGEFRALEAAARAARRGLWGACDPVPPACT